MPKNTRATRAARSVLQDAGVRRAPVDVYKLARLHAEVVEKEMPDSISGMLIPAPEAIRGKNYVIVVNATHAEVRRRFTVAHELGHLLLHDYKTPHADTGFAIRFRANRDYDGSVSEEIEANRFAAEILMPSQMIIERVAEVDFEYAPMGEGDDEALSRLASEFRVSKKALQIRLSELI